MRTTQRERAGEINSKVPTTELSVLNLDEIAKFLSLGGNTLLIKGYAGAGKTTLALQLLSQLSPGGRGVYISSRVSKEKIVHQLPWLRKGGKRPEDDYDFLDIRLGTGVSVLDEVLKMVGSRSRRKSVQVIVLDTWDGLAKEMDEKERLKMEKTLVALADFLRARMIFVSEEPGRTTMDYLVDGIVELVRSEKYERVFREIEIQKLRGSLVDQHKYLYTLLGGMFRHLAPYARPSFSNARKPRPIGDSDFAYSFGSREMDIVFGGLRKGNTFAFEYDDNVPYSAIRTVEIAAVVNALNVGHGVFLIPLPGAATEWVASLVKPFVTREALEKRFAIATMENKGISRPPFYGVGAANVKETEASISELIEKVRSNSVKKSVLVVESIGLLENAFASNTSAAMEILSSRISNIQRESVDAILLLVHRDSQVRSRVLAMSGEYARLFTMDRSVVMLGEKPSTAAFVLEHNSENPLLPKLTKIV